MLFCSQQFVVFFLIVFSLYWLIPWPRPRVYLLLAASFIFYASWNFHLAALIFITTAIDYHLAHWIRAAGSRRAQRGIMAGSIVMNLGLLSYFKYSNFFLHSAQQALNALGMIGQFPVLKVILPVGISFYTFEAINYVVDVYKGKTPAERNLANFMLFITFFPHLVAGPIVRARDFLPQINRIKHWDWQRLELGAQYFTMGLLKKVLADRMAPFADPVFAHPHWYRSGVVWTGVVAYAMQIYCDFSGYSDMAIGCAHMLGYKLAQNFNVPYVATSVAEFWHRWHISLSTWLRDYLYIPLGGSRTTPAKTDRNLMITMVLGGLWHGASWTFVLWGFLHGILLVGHRRFRKLTKNATSLNEFLASLPGTGLRIGLTFVVICVTWVFFRSQSLGDALVIVGRMFSGRGGLPAAVPTGQVWFAFTLMMICHAMVAYDLWPRLKSWIPSPLYGAATGAAFTLALFLAPVQGHAFIYFQF